MLFASTLLQVKMENDRRRSVDRERQAAELQQVILERKA